MYLYNSRLYLRYQRPICSLVVLGDDQPNWPPSRFEYHLWGSRVSLEFPNVMLLDYRGREEERKRSSHPFAWFVRAHLRTLATSQDPEQRLEDKKFLNEDLLAQERSEQDFYIHFKNIDALMVLPEKIERTFLKYNISIKREKRCRLSPL